MARADYGWRVAAGMLLLTFLVWTAVVIVIAAVTNLLLPATGYQEADQAQAEQGE
jgi:hypothetical protein